jgi:hypothetical protein
MTTTAPEEPRTPRKDAADEPRRDQDRPDAPPGSADDEQPDFSAEFDHPSGRLEPMSRWEP